VERRYGGEARAEVGDKLTKNMVLTIENRLGDQKKWRPAFMRMHANIANLT